MIALVFIAVSVCIYEITFFHDGNACFECLTKMVIKNFSSCDSLYQVDISVMIHVTIR